MNPAYSAEMTEFNRLYKETDNIYTRYAASQGISTTTLCVLYSLYLSEAYCTQSQLVEDWGIPMQTVNSCLQAMKKSGIVRLEFREGNRKSKSILLTEQGAEMAQKIVAPLVEAENQALGALDPGERRKLLELTRKHCGLLRQYLLNEKGEAYGRES